MEGQDMFMFMTEFDAMAKTAILAVLTLLLFYKIFKTIFEQFAAVTYSMDC